MIFLVQQTDACFGLLLKSPILIFAPLYKLHMFNNRAKISEVLKLEPTGQIITVMGWVRTFRNNQFIALNDGSTIHNIQCVVDFENTPEETLKRITTGAAVCVVGL